MALACNGRSTAPTPFAGYSFHVAEAALVFANEITVVFLFPIHAGLHRVYHLATTAIHIGALAESLHGVAACGPLLGLPSLSAYDVRPHCWELCCNNARALVAMS